MGYAKESSFSFLTKRNPMENQDGFALLVVLIIIAILTPLVVNMSYKTRVHIAGADYFTSKVKSMELARAGLESAMLALKEDKNKEYDSYLEDWGKFEELSLFSETFFEEGSFTGRIYDEEGKFNVTRLSRDSTLHGQLEILLQQIGADPDILDALMDWLDIDSEVNLTGAEDYYYSSMKNPYYSKDGMMDNIYELRLIKGMSDDIFLGNEESHGIADFVAVRGTETRVNINTAPFEVIMALAEGMDSITAEEIISQREEEPFYSVEDIQKIKSMDSDLMDAIKSRIKVTSNYFSINIMGYFRDVSTNINALVNRSGDSIRIVHINEV